MIVKAIFVKMVINDKAVGIMVFAFDRFFKQLAWVTFIPLWQTPDEQAHSKNLNIEYSSDLFGPGEKEIMAYPQSYRQDYLLNEATAYPPLYYRLSALI